MTNNNNNNNDYDAKHIEKFFPIHEVNKIAGKESKAKRYYRPVYTMHKWWARRLGSVFRSILLYSLADEDMKVLERDKDFEELWKEIDELPEPEDLWDEYYLEDVDFNGKTVLDPFMGGGTTIVEALRMGANVIGKDLNPVAWFTVKKETDPVDLNKLNEAFKKLKEEVAPEIKKYYKTTCPVCGKEADAMYYFWIKELKCRNCESTVPLFKGYRVAKSRSNNVEHKHKVICNNCGETFEPGEKCPHCGEKYNHKDYYHIHCPKCGRIFESPNYKEENSCPYCEHKFNPKDDGNASGKYFTCPECGQKNEVVGTIKEQGKPDERLWAVEYYCSHCDMKGYKPAKKEDKDLFVEAAKEYETTKDKLPIPQQKIPDGHNTRQMTKQGYKNFKDMFNERQLLNLGKLLEWILNIENKKVEESLLLTLSEILDYNNEFCTYERSRNHSGHLFSKHAFHPRHMYVENNIFGTKYGIGTFVKAFKKTRAGIKYINSPFEKYREDNQTKEKEMNVPIDEQLVSDFGKLGKNGNTLITSGDSSDLQIPDKSVDAVITDPPYFDNVMYSELSDFYYVWLREGLKDDYENFQSKLTPKRGEIVENSVQGKDESFYTDGLTRVFKESRKKMKDDGIMAFTFHHKDTEAWSSALKSILDAGLYVSSVYSIQSEMSTSTHIHEKSSIKYDMIVVCRKKKESKRVTWRSLEDEIYLKTQDEIEDLEERGMISDGDKFVIAMGKALEAFSRHYPNIIYDGEKISEREDGISEAIGSIQSIVDKQFHVTRLDELTEKTDLETALYLSFVAGKDEVDYSEVNKSLQQRNISADILVDNNFVKREGGKLKPVKPIDRDIMDDDPEDMKALDKAHYLYNLYQEDKLGASIPDLGPYVTEESLNALSELSNSEDDETYERIKKFIESKKEDIQIQTKLI